MHNTKPHMGMMADIVSMLTGQATCATASATADKVASLAGFSLRAGVRVAVNFANKNTVAGALTLDVNSAGAKTICDESGQAVSATNKAYFPDGCEIEFIYDGTNWRYLRRVVKVYSNSTQEYEIRSDGRIRQSGRVSNPGNATTTVSLIIPFLETNYKPSVEFLAGQTHYSTVGFTRYDTKTVSSFQFTGTGYTTETPYVAWTAEGF